MSQALKMVLSMVVTVCPLFHIQELLLNGMLFLKAPTGTEMFQQQWSTVQMVMHQSNILKLILFDKK